MVYIIRHWNDCHVFNTSCLYKVISVWMMFSNMVYTCLLVICPSSPTHRVSMAVFFVDLLFESISPIYVVFGCIWMHFRTLYCEGHLNCFTHLRESKDNFIYNRLLLGRNSFSHVDQFMCALISTIFDLLSYFALQGCSNHSKH